MLDLHQVALGVGTVFHIRILAGIAQGSSMSAVEQNDVLDTHLVCLDVGFERVVVLSRTD